MDTFKTEMVPSCLSVEEFKNAELEIIGFCLWKRLPEELSRLQKDRKSAKV